MNPIKKFRLSVPMSQQQLADAVGVHQTAIAQWESGRTSPRLGRLIRLSKVLGCTVEQLLGSDDHADDARS